MLKKKLTPEELQKAREEAERKARRGEIEPTHDFTFNLISQFTGLTKVRKGLLFVVKSLITNFSMPYWNSSSRTPPS